jgi:hypothetical protein
VSLALDLEKYLHLSAVAHACDWLIMRARFGLAPNTSDACARFLHSYFSFAVNAGIEQENN